MSRMRPYRRRGHPPAYSPAVKRQKMQWTKRDARLLSVPRALDGTLRPLFGRWYPGLANDTVASNVQVGAA